jgi:hypothetical protein
MSLDLPEPPRPSRDGGLPRWLEWVTAISALVVSVASIFLAVRNGEAQDKLVKASSYPYLIGVSSDATAEGADRISVDLFNNGVGPAHEQSLKIRLGDRYVTSVDDLIATAVGPKEAKPAIAALVRVRNSVPSRFLAPKDNQFIFRIAKTPANAAYWEKVDATIPIWHIEYCYCSVFEECWAVVEYTHTPVKACHRDEPHEFNP